MAKEKLYCFNCREQQPTVLSARCGSCGERLVAGTQQEVQAPRIPTASDLKMYQKWLEGMQPGTIH